MKLSKHGESFEAKVYAHVQILNIRSDCLFFQAFHKFPKLL
jgi:hypothetical protein